MNEAAKKSETLCSTKDRVTVYVSGGLGNVVAVKSTGAEITLKAMNSWQRTMCIEVKKYRKRTKSRFGRKEGALCVVVKGWDAPTPEGIFGDANNQGVSHQRHDTFSDTWEQNFRKQLAASRSTVLFDASAQK